MAHKVRGCNTFGWSYDEHCDPAVLADPRPGSTAGSSNFQVTLPLTSGTHPPPRYAPTPRRDVTSTAFVEADRPTPPPARAGGTSRPPPGRRRAPRTRTNDAEGTQGSPPRPAGTSPGSPGPAPGFPGQRRHLAVRARAGPPSPRPTPRSAPRARGGTTPARDDTAPEPSGPLAPPQPVRASTGTALPTTHRRPVRWPGSGRRWPKSTPSARASTTSTEANPRPAGTPSRRHPERRPGPNGRGRRTPARIRRGAARSRSSARQRVSTAPGRPPWPPSPAAGSAPARSRSPRPPAPGAACPWPPAPGRRR